MNANEVELHAKCRKCRRLYGETLIEPEDVERVRYAAKVIREEHAQSCSAELVIYARAKVEALT